MRTANAQVRWVGREGRLSHPVSNLDHLLSLLVLLRDLQKLADDGPKIGRKHRVRHRQKQTRLTQSDVDAMVRDHEAGASSSALAEKYGVHRHTVARHLTSRGLLTRRNVRKLTDQQIADASAEHKLGVPATAIARELGVHPATVRRALR